MNALYHQYKLACSAYAFHSAPRLSAARSIYGAVLSVSCACAWIRETSSVGLCGALAGDAAMGVSSLFNVILRIRAFLEANWSAH